MDKADFIQVFEYGKLKWSENSFFQEYHFNAMVKFNEKNHNKYFTVIHKGVQFNSYVGVIKIGKLTLEILPKADNRNNTSKKLWQSVLLDMLSTCKKINVNSVSETTLEKRYKSILEIYFDIFLDEIETLIKKGLLKKYRRIKSNQLALKGKLLFAENIQRNLIHKERFYCEHQSYDKDHLLHQIIYRALLVLKDLINSSLEDKLNRILYYFQDFKEIKVAKKHFEKLTLGRKELPYNKAVDISKMLILNYSPNLNSGNDNMLTLLFDMNMLWEEYIYRVLQKHRPLGFKVSFQNSAKFWENKKIRPDIVITNSDNEILVIDTKWKIVNNNSPSDNDLKQMFTYNLYWKAKRSLLLYPNVGQNDSKFGKYHYLPDNTSENACKLGFVNVLDAKNRLNPQAISSDIFSKFL